MYSLVVYFWKGYPKVGKEKEKRLFNGMTEQELRNILSNLRAQKNETEIVEFKEAKTGFH